VFAFAETRGPVDVAFTDRLGGVSEEPYTSLNLAATGHDDDRSIAENLHRVVERFAGRRDAPVAAMHQVHGGDVVVIGPDDRPGPARPGTTGLPEADGLVTAERDVVLLVRAADCVPVLVADVARGVVGAFHAGRPGLAAGVVPHGVAAMRELGASELVAWVGPHVCGRCYEVPPELREEVSALVPEARAETSWGTPALDIGAGVVAQLRREGAEVVTVERCTREDEELYSHRRDGGRAGRAAGLVRVQA
jgi:YfiH family protein